MATTSNGLLPLKNDINTVWKRVFHEKSNRVEIRPFLKIVMVIMIIIMIIIMTIIIIIFFFDFVAISCHLETIAKSFFLHDDDDDDDDHGHDDHDDDGDDLTG